MNILPSNEFASDDALFEDMERHLYEPLPSDLIATDWMELPQIEPEWLNLPTIEQEWLEMPSLEQEPFPFLSEPANDLDLDF